MIFLPLRDDKPLTHIRRPWITWGLIAVCVVVHLYQRNLDHYAEGLFVLQWGLSLAHGQGPDPLAFLTHQFLHGSWWHLVGNMMFLAIFGDNVEDAMGHLRFLVFYLLCGVLAASIELLLAPLHGTMIGASGAISGVLGAYLVLYPNIRIWTLVLLVMPVRIPVWVVLGGWVTLEVLALIEGSYGHVAVLAHVGGFVFGMGLIRVFRRKGLPLWNKDEYGRYSVGARRSHLPRVERPPEPVDEDPPE